MVRAEASRERVGMRPKRAVGPCMPEYYVSRAGTDSNTRVVGSLQMYLLRAEHKMQGVSWQLVRQWSARLPRTLLGLGRADR